MHPHPELYPHQKEVLGRMKDGCIVYGGVGSGKSRVGLAYYTMTDQHEDVYIITTAKKRDSLDWEMEAMRFGVGKEHTLYGKLVVDSWNNIHKHIDVKNAFFIFDEQRLIGDGKWSKAFLKIAKANRWIMLSATPGDTWMDYIPVFVANGFYRNRTEFKREHVIFKPYLNYPVVDRYVGTAQLIKHRNEILVEMPYLRHTKRNKVNVWCDYDAELMKTVRETLWNPYKDEPIRDKAELFHVMRRVTNSDISRKDRILELLQKHPKLIVFYNFNYELEAIHALTGTLWQELEPYPMAEWNGHKHQEIPVGDRWLYAVQYAAGAEGWNCITTDATAFWSLPYSYKLFEQAHGRIDRLNTPFTDLYYYALRSRADIDFAIWRALMSKKSFQTNHFYMENDEFAEMVIKG